MVPEEAKQVESLVKRSCEKIWDRPVRDVTRDDVVNILRPSFPGKAVTGRRLSMYLANVLALAVAEGARPAGAHPAAWKHKSRHDILGTEVQGR